MVCPAHWLMKRKLLMKESLGKLKGVIDNNQSKNKSKKIMLPTSICNKMLVENINANPASLFIHQKTTIREYNMKGIFFIRGYML
jgi:hypothetical protein